MLKFGFFATLLLVLGLSLFYWMRSSSAAAPDLAPADQHIDQIIIEKARRAMTLYRDGQAVKSYQIRLGFSPSGQKSQEGDGKTPEGEYRINRRNPRSKFHLSLGLDYPLPHQQQEADALGIDPGGDIFVHGQPNWVKGLTTFSHDWTDGCVALSNQEIEEIWRIVPIGTKVSILP